MNYNKLVGRLKWSMKGTSGTVQGKPGGTEIFHSLLGTKFGPVAILWSVRTVKTVILRIVLSRPGAPAARIVMDLFPGCIRKSSPEIDLVAEQIELFLSGSEVRFSLDAVGIDICHDFQRRVLLAEFGIPRGHVSTYRRIAAHLGIPSGARAVGNALASNPFPVIIPCHRAIRSDGTLGGFQGGIGMKRALLEMEGIRFSESGRVISDDIFY